MISSKANILDEASHSVRSKYCIVVPHYNHLSALTAFLPKLVSLDMDCIIVDDGSDSAVKTDLAQQLIALEGFHLVELAENQGKGAAMQRGAKYARQLGFTHMLQIDADGQHDIADVPAFISYSLANPQHIVSGAPVFDDSAPKARVYGRKVTDFWVALETLSFAIKDSLCGFRIYPLAQFASVHENYSIGSRMDFDTDVLVKSAWLGISIHYITTKVIYLDNSVSHFHYLRDNLRLIWLHTRLMFGMLLRLPKLLYWRLRGRSKGST